MYHNYYIPLNKTCLLLVHRLSSPVSPLESPSNATPPLGLIPVPTVVQVTIKPANVNLADEMAAFYLNQYEITVRLFSLFLFLFLFLFLSLPFSSRALTKQ
ncbi:hypothetical protein NP233_g9758 [Leucocoprinus birnbaumii]|uniref:Uncharacterized protein n=1 Tax=Leucocoprinus birnbaumii TaxID=56174 RepID=A0AAD5VJV1_9AGAR|nr:hypothetical protein NP233_g9758 [Leucocoprinus birnbaumii]